MTTKPPATQGRAKPLKRPTQARAKMTVQAIFDTYVRIWQRDGWERATTRAIALEAGVAVGTLYDYFPNKHALHSGYIRHCIEALLEAIELQIVQPTELTWQARVGKLVRMLAGVESDLPWFSHDMLELEAQVAELKHQQRAYEEMLASWQRVLQAALTCTACRRRRPSKPCTWPSGAGDATPCWYSWMRHACNAGPSRWSGFASWRLAARLPATLSLLT